MYFSLQNQEFNFMGVNKLWGEKLAVRGAGNLFVFSSIMGDYPEQIVAQFGFKKSGKEGKSFLFTVGLVFVGMFRLPVFGGPCLQVKYLRRSINAIF